jgi:hypothetical protein
MSVAAVEWVLKQAPDHTAPARAVALVLAWHHSPERGAFPKRSTIVAETCLGDGTVGRALRALEAEGTIRRDGARPGGGTIVWRFPALNDSASVAEPEAVRPERPDRPERPGGSAAAAGSVRPEWPTIGQGIETERSEQPTAVEGATAPDTSPLMARGRSDVAREAGEDLSREGRSSENGDDDGPSQDEVRADIRSSLAQAAAGTEGDGA